MTPYKRPLNTALKYFAYALTDSPISVEKKLPGNIGEGISRDANVNIRKKTIRISTPLIADSP